MNVLLSSLPPTSALGAEDEDAGTCPIDVTSAAEDAEVPWITAAKGTALSGGGNGGGGGG